MKYNYIAIMSLCGLMIIIASNGKWKDGWEEACERN